MTKVSTLVIIGVMALSTGIGAAEASTAKHTYKPASVRMQEMLQTLEASPALAPQSPVQRSGTWAWVKHWLIGLGLSGEDTETIETIAPVDSSSDIIIEQSAPGAANTFYKLQIGKGHKADIRQHGAGNSATILQSN